MSKKNIMVDPHPQDAASVAATVATHAPNHQNNPNNSTALPKCFCNWKHCRTYQKTFREYKHATLNGVVKLKFTKGVPKSMAFKAVVERTLHVPQEKRNDWRPEVPEGGASADPNNSNTPTPTGGDYVRYYVARHHFTEALMKQYLADRRAWDWNEPLSLKQAKTFLWSLDRHDIYKDPNVNADNNDEEEEEDLKYMQAPNVPKDQVRDCLRQLKLQVQEQKGKSSTNNHGSGTNGTTTTSPGKGTNKKATAAANHSNSAHTQSTLSTSVTDTLKAFEDVIGHGEPPHLEHENYNEEEASGELLAVKTE